MSDFLNNLVWMFGGICLIAVIVEFPYSIIQGREFSLSASSVGFYLAFSFLFALYKVYTARKKSPDQTTETP